MTHCSTSKLRTGVQIVALLSILIGIGIIGLSSWILHKSLQMRRNHEINGGKELFQQVNPHFGGTSSGSSGPSRYDFEAIFRILITNSATALGGGFFQLIFSLALFLASIKGGIPSVIAGKVWVYSHILIMLTIGSATLCILTNELQLNWPIRLFLIATGTDSLLIVFFMWLVYFYAFKEGEENIDQVKRMKGSVYQSPPGYNISLTSSSPPPPPPSTTTIPNNNGKGIVDFRDMKLRPISIV